MKCLHSKQTPMWDKPLVSIKNKAPLSGLDGCLEHPSDDSSQLSWHMFTTGSALLSPMVITWGALDQYRASLLTATKKDIFVWQIHLWRASVGEVENPFLTYLK
ncbi:unnamed protein product [Danaus chrysippus]|uniref:(African queen) hypothetical protein n=1 Tax=Danaus chrysippus TaxID=151541 RepID=A0A8J2VZG7_9NEOP|nr:unnamed protein product [Danaus chrysippus]